MRAFRVPVIRLTMSHANRLESLKREFRLAYLSARMCVRRVRSELKTAAIEEILAAPFQLHYGRIVTFLALLTLPFFFTQTYLLLPDQEAFGLALILILVLLQNLTTV